MAYSLIAHDSAGGDTDIATTAGVDTTGADLLVVVAASYSPRDATITDSKGNTWTSLTRYGAAGNRVQFFYCQGGTVGPSHTFTATGGVDGYYSIAVLALSGSVASPADGENGATDVSPGSVTPSQDNDILITALCYYPSNTPTIGSGFTISDNVDYVAEHMGIALAYKIQTSAGAENPTWSPSSSFGEKATAMVAFKAAAGGGGGGVLAGAIYHTMLSGGNPLA